MKDRSYIHWKLGQLGVPYESMSDLMGRAIIDHKGFQPGYADIPGTDLRLKYEPGIDGWETIRRLRAEGGREVLQNLRRVGHRSNQLLRNVLHRVRNRRHGVGVPSSTVRWRGRFFRSATNPSPHASCSWAGS